MSLSYHHVDSRSTFQVQCDVIAALIMRELTTRFGRDNIGYLWIVGEPMMLAGVVTLFHVINGGEHGVGHGITPATFTISGYVPYAMLRSIINRAEAALESNRALLYHRMVTLSDILIARLVLEYLAIMLTMLILEVIVFSIGLGELPDRPLVMLAGMTLLAWLCYGTSMIVAALAERSPTFGRLVHPFTYFLIPVCGAFFLMRWMPAGFRGFLEWVPLTSIFELIREGQYGQFESEYIHLGYVIGWCLVCHAVGLYMLRGTRRHIHME